jgi:hypothetical protein
MAAQNEGLAVIIERETNKSAINIMLKQVHVCLTFAVGLA